MPGFGGMHTHALKAESQAWNPDELQTRLCVACTPLPCSPPPPLPLPSAPPPCAPDPSEHGLYLTALPLPPLMPCPALPLPPCASDPSERGLQRETSMVGSEASSTWGGRR